MSAITLTDVGKHYDKFLDQGQRTKTYASVIGGGVDLVCYGPTSDRPFWTVCTLGISDTRMNVPADLKQIENERAEIFMYLPANWDFPVSLSGKYDAKSWPLEMLRCVGSYVKKSGNWISMDHAIPNLDRMGKSYCDSTKLASIVLLEPVTEDASFEKLHDDPMTICINFWLVVPITTAEHDWKKRVGIEDSIFYVVGDKREHPESVAIDYITDPRRKCAVNDLHADVEIEKMLRSSSAE
tara:strand:- start:395 stop:1114 length:720 start_codon:yes stop_codon:yes gene_type:complete